MLYLVRKYEMTRFKGVRCEEDVMDIARFETVGIFDSKELAEEKCLDTSYCVQPIELNKVYEKRNQSWDNVYYPKQKVDNAEY